MLILGVLLIALPAAVLQARAEVGADTEAVGASLAAVNRAELLDELAAMAGSFEGSAEGDAVGAETRMAELYSGSGAAGSAVPGVAARALSPLPESRAAGTMRDSKSERAALADLPNNESGGGIATGEALETPDSVDPGAGDDGQASPQVGDAQGGHVILLVLFLVLLVLL